jgi:hypothetical protein
MKPGVHLICETVGAGDPVERQATYLVRLQMWLRRGDPVAWSRPWGLIDRARLESGGTILVTDLRVDRESMFPGLFYGVQGMRVGGTRRLKISPHLAYGDAGSPGIIPPNAVLTVEIAVLELRWGARA